MPANVAQLKPKAQVGKKVWQLNDFVNDTSIVKPEVLLSPWLCRGDLWMVYSGPGIGKTFFALNVAFAVASGGKFLHWMAPKSAKVLYVDGEMSPWDMKQRLTGILASNQKYSHGSKQDALDNFFGYCATYQEPGKPFPDLAEPEGRATLIELAEGKDLVVIDNLTTTLRGADPDKAMDWTPMQDMLVELRKQEITVLLVHHTNKSGDQTGTKAKEAILNGMMKLERPSDYSPSDGARFNITWGKTRGLSGTDTTPVRAQLTEGKDDHVLHWDFTVLDDLKAHELIRLARTGNYATQRELAEAMEISTGRVSQLKASAINDYQLCTAMQFANMLKAGKELRNLEDHPEFDAGF